MSGLFKKGKDPVDKDWIDFFQKPYDLLNKESKLRDKVEYFSFVCTVIVGLAIILLASTFKFSTVIGAAFMLDFIKIGLSIFFLALLVRISSLLYKILVLLRWRALRDFESFKKLRGDKRG